MDTEKKQAIAGSQNDFLFHVLLVFFLFFFVSSHACGRRGDPVLIAPQDEKSIDESISDKDEEEVTGAEEVPVKEEEAGIEESEVARPDAPTGLAALFTQKSIILTWDAVLRQGVKSYRIYRSTGEDFKLAREVVTPTFTDHDITLDAEYIYRVTAVGNTESPPSEEITIITEKQ